MVEREKVSIDQACSGIRSLQSLFSFALFFSIYDRHDWLRALMNFSWAIAFALVFNSLRALTLSLVFLEYGREVQEDWHNTIGNTFVFVAMACLGLSSWALAEKKESQTGTIKPLASKPVPWSFAGAFVLPEILVLSWFALLPGQPQPFSWEISLGSGAERIPEGVRKVLLFDYGEQGEIDLEGKSRANVIHFGYEKESAAASLCSRNHDPATCMQYTGVRLLDSDDLVRYQFEGNELLFRHYATPPDRPQDNPGFHVFWCSSVLDSRIDSFEFEHPSIWSKSVRFLSGKLSYERKVLLISLSGNRTRKKAEADLQQVLQAILRPAGSQNEELTRVSGSL